MWQRKRPTFLCQHMCWHRNLEAKQRQMFPHKVPVSHRRQFEDDKCISVNMKRRWKIKLAVLWSWTLFCFMQKFQLLCKKKIRPLMLIISKTWISWEHICKIGKRGIGEFEISFPISERSLLVKKLSAKSFSCITWVFLGVLSFEFYSSVDIKEYSEPFRLKLIVFQLSFLCLTHSCSIVLIIDDLYKRIKTAFLNISPLRSSATLRMPWPASL